MARFFGRLSEKKMVNLTGISNSDLKLKYGTGNFNDLSAADNNYIRLIQWSGKLLTCLEEEGRIEDARPLIDFLSENGISSKIISRYTKKAEDGSPDT